MSSHQLFLSVIEAATTKQDIFNGIEILADQE
jgi:hypothetical protein